MVQGSGRQAPRRGGRSASTTEQRQSSERETIRELETPVIQVWSGILALPIVGTVDTRRAQDMNERLLEKIVETNSEVVLLDITGVPVVDTAVARHLLETVSAARLLGADVMVVGLSSRTAMTLVQLGIELAGISTGTTMAKALDLAFRRLGLEVVPRRGTAFAAEDGLV
jgi:rsbT co-antagonist protein RsbR